MSKLNSEWNPISFTRSYLLKWTGCSLCCEELEGNINKFLSTSVTQKGVFSGNPNVAIIIPRSVNGAYIETVSEKPKQREFLLGVGVKLRKLLEYEESIICEVIVDGI